MSWHGKPLSLDLFLQKMKNEYTHLDLFSGIGGFSLAAESVGFRTVAFCERESYPIKVLNERWPGIPIENDIYTLDGTKYRGISLVTGGFPCQPFSIIGKQKGKSDNRYLWPEMCRIIYEAQPDWVLGENVVGLDGLALEECLSDLESINYEVAPPFEIPACAVGAWHQRKRIWIIANRIAEKSPDPFNKPSRNGCLGQSRQPKREIFQSVFNSTNNNYESVYSKIRMEEDTFNAEPDLVRMVHGIPLASHRNKALGNAIVPQLASVILKNIMAIELKKRI